MKSERERKSDVQKIGRSGAIMRKNQYIQTGQERVCVRVCLGACVRGYVCMREIKIKNESVKGLCLWKLELNTDE